jgi:hypothetical protein
MIPNHPPFPYIRKNSQENLEFWEAWLFYYWLNQMLGFHTIIGDFHKYAPQHNIPGSIACLTETSKITINRWFERIKRKIREIEIADNDIFDRLSKGTFAFERKAIDLSDI